MRGQKANAEGVCLSLECSSQLHRWTPWFQEWTGGRKASKEGSECPRKGMGIWAGVRWQLARAPPQILDLGTAFLSSRALTLCPEGTATGLL